MGSPRLALSFDGALAYPANAGDNGRCQPRSRTAGHFNAAWNCTSVLTTPRGKPEAASQWMWGLATHHNAWSFALALDNQGHPCCCIRSLGQLNKPRGAPLPSSPHHSNLSSARPAYISMHRIAQTVHEALTLNMCVYKACIHVAMDALRNLKCREMISNPRRID